MDIIHMNYDRVLGYGLDSYEWGHSPVAGFCKHATEKRDMKKRGNFLAQLGY